MPSTVQVNSLVDSSAATKNIISINYDDTPYKDDGNARVGSRYNVTINKSSDNKAVLTVLSKTMYSLSIKENNHNSHLFANELISTIDLSTIYLYNSTEGTAFHILKSPSTGTNSLNEILSNITHIIILGNLNEEEFETNFQLTSIIFITKYLIVTDNIQPLLFDNMFASILSATVDESDFDKREHIKKLIYLNIKYIDWLSFRTEIFEADYNSLYVQKEGGGKKKAKNKNKKNT